MIRYWAPLTILSDDQYTISKARRPKIRSRIRASILDICIDVARPSDIGHSYWRYIVSLLHRTGRVGLTFAVLVSSKYGYSTKLGIPDPFFQEIKAPR